MLSSSCKTGGRSTASASSRFRFSHSLHGFDTNLAKKRFTKIPIIIAHTIVNSKNMIQEKNVPSISVKKKIYPTLFF